MKKMKKGTVIAELEGGLLKSSDPFPYFMLVAFEASGLLRFATLLLSWPLLKLLDSLGLQEASLKMAIFIAIAGVKETEIEGVARAVLPKFYMDDVDMHGAWGLYGGGYERRRVVDS